MDDLFIALGLRNVVFIALYQFYSAHTVQANDYIVFHNDGQSMHFIEFIILFSADQFNEQYKYQFLKSLI